jgi:hypothetical protein
MSFYEILELLLNESSLLEVAVVLAAVALLYRLLFASPWRGDAVQDRVRDCVPHIVVLGFLLPDRLHRAAPHHDMHVPCRASR